MITLEEISLDKKELINSFLTQKCTQNSEFTFTNLFMWRKSYDIRYAIIDGMFCVMPQHTGGPRSATFPLGTGNPKPVIEKLLVWFKERGEEPLIRLYNDEAVSELEEMFPGKFLITEDVGSFDYVYSTEELIQLSGKKFHTKKNHVNKFKRLYDYEYQRLTLSDRAEVEEMYNRWYDNKEDIPGLTEEREAVMELLKNWGHLDITGACLRVDGKMAAFSFGEPLCCNMAVIHLEHADMEYEGSFAAMNQMFLENEWADFPYVNREEDMGLEGMRRAKLSYRPIFQVKKYVATLNHTL